MYEFIYIVYNIKSNPNGRYFQILAINEEEAFKNLAVSRNESWKLVSKMELKAKMIQSWKA